jgi:hypothetical protein
MKELPRLIQQAKEEELNPATVLLSGWTMTTSKFLAIIWTLIVLTAVPLALRSPHEVWKKADGHVLA